MTDMMKVKPGMSLWVSADVGGSLRLLGEWSSQTWPQRLFEAWKRGGDLPVASYSDRIVAGCLRPGAYTEKGRLWALARAWLDVKGNVSSAIHDAAKDGATAVVVTTGDRPPVRGDMVTTSWWDEVDGPGDVTSALVAAYRATNDVGIFELVRTIQVSLPQWWVGTGGRVWWEGIVAGTIGDLCVAIGSRIPGAVTRDSDRVSLIEAWRTAGADDVVRGLEMAYAVIGADAVRIVDPAKDLAHQFIYLGPEHVDSPSVWDLFERIRQIRDGAVKGDTAADPDGVPVYVRIAKRHGSSYRLDSHVRVVVDVDRLLSDPLPAGRRRELGRWWDSDEAVRWWWAHAPEITRPDALVIGSLLPGAVTTSENLAELARAWSGVCDEISATLDGLVGTDVLVVIRSVMAGVPPADSAEWVGYWDLFQRLRESHATFAPPVSGLEPPLIASSIVDDATAVGMVETALSGEVLTAVQLARATGLDPNRVASALDVLSRAGRVRREDGHWMLLVDEQWIPQHLHVCVDVLDAVHAGPITREGLLERLAAPSSAWNESQVDHALSQLKDSAKVVLRHNVLLDLADDFEYDHHVREAQVWIVVTLANERALSFRELADKSRWTHVLLASAVMRLVRMGWLASDSGELRLLWDGVR